MFASAFILLLGVSAAFAAPGDPDHLCGNHPNSTQVDDVNYSFSTGLKVARINVKAVCQKWRTIPVYFHVIRKGLAVSDGNVPNNQIIDQIRSLNQDFESSKLKFDLKGVDYTTNSAWFEYDDMHGIEQRNMKNALRIGGRGTLNVYSVGKAGGFWGYSSFPWEWGTDPENDGAVIKFEGMPGGQSPWDLGKWLTHEVGHWSGLLHTFQNGCDFDGDLVNDTPFEARPANGCPVGSGLDTCTTKPGLDPIHNFMDYTYDSCKTEFTKGQSSHLRAVTCVFRNIC